MNFECDSNANWDLASLGVAFRIYIEHLLGYISRIYKSIKIS